MVVVVAAAAAVSTRIDQTRLTGPLQLQVDDIT